MNQNLLEWLKLEQVEVDTIRGEKPEESGVEKSELDEMFINRYEFGLLV